MSEGAADGRVHIRLMNEYGCELPLWPDDLETDVDKLGMSTALIADLKAFADRWDQAISPEVFDDRWDSSPIMRSLVGARYSLGRLFHPAQQRAYEAEQGEMRRIGGEL